MGEPHDYEAKVVYERHYAVDDERGPQEFGKVGVAIGEDVFWIGSYYFPGTGAVEHADDLDFATEIARRWNAAPATPEKSS